MEHAERNRHLAVDRAKEIASVRAVDRLSEVAELAKPHAPRAGIAALIERISELAAL